MIRIWFSFLYRPGNTSATDDTCLHRLDYLQKPCNPAPSSVLPWNASSVPRTTSDISHPSVSPQHKSCPTQSDYISLCFLTFFFFFFSPTATLSSDSSAISDSRPRAEDATRNNSNANCRAAETDDPFDAGDRKLRDRFRGCTMLAR